MQGALPLEDPTGRHVWSVGELLEDLRENLEQGYPLVCVRGELSQFRTFRSGHWYFNLKDDDALLRCAMYRGDNIRVPFRPEDGLEVALVGRLSAFVPRGDLQLVANQMEPVGWGARQLAFEQLKRRLEAEGLFDPDRRREPPLLPRCIGVVTSRNGAAWSDLVRVWERREVAMRVILAPTRVQGDEAAGEIARAIGALDGHGAAEVIVVTRGGGSRDDLWAFNEEAVVRAVAGAGVPVIAAVGHEIDTTLVELVADVRAATPTAAAEIVAPSRDELLTRLEAIRRAGADRMAARVDNARARLQNRVLARRLERPGQVLRVYQQRLDGSWEALRRGLDSARGRRAARLSAAAVTLARRAPAATVRRHERQLEDAFERVDDRFHARLRSARERIATVAARTEAMSPLAVLGRGYALCQDESSGALLRDAASTERGARVAVRLHRGVLRCEVRERELARDEATPGSAE